MDADAAPGRINTELFQKEACATFRDVMHNVLLGMMQRTMYDARLKAGDDPARLQHEYRKGMVGISTVHNAVLDDFAKETQQRYEMLPALYRAVFLLFASHIFTEQMPVSVDRTRIDFASGIRAIVRTACTTEAVLTGEFLLSMREIEQTVTTEAIVRRALLQEVSSGIEYLRAPPPQPHNQPPPPQQQYHHPPPLPPPQAPPPAAAAPSAATAADPHRRSIVSGWGSAIGIDTTTMDVKPPSFAGSAKGSVAGSAKGSVAGSAKGSVAGSAKGSVKGSRAASELMAPSEGGESLDVLSRINNRAPHGVGMPRPAPPSVMSAGTHGFEDKSGDLMLLGSEHSYTAEVRRRIADPTEGGISAIAIEDSASQVAGK